MDKQRIARRFGLANVFVVLPICDPALLSQLGSVTEELSTQYRAFGGTCVEHTQLHVSLVGLHCAPASLERVCEALRAWEGGMDERWRARDVCVRGLGAWVTAGGKWVLFAELEREDATWVAELAEALSQHLVRALGADAEGYFDDDCAWVDVVHRDVHQPHVTLSVIDPTVEKDLVKELEARSGKASDKSGGGDKNNNKGRKKLSAREKSQQEGRRERVLESRKQEEATFGRQVHLFKKERKRYKGFVFGTQRCDAIHVEMAFQVHLRKELGPYLGPESRSDRNEEDESSE